MSPRLPVWIAERGGLRFECQRCTNCCHGPGYIDLAEGEVARISEFLGIDEALFRAQHLPSRGEDRMHVADGAPCPFLDGNACRIQAVKPLQCRAWPFFHDLLETELSWRLGAQGCPGMDRGPLHPPTEIVEWLKRLAE